MLEKFKDSKFIFVVGIGGSNLASKAVWNAMTLHKTGIEKKVFFLEAPDSREYEEVEDFVKNGIANPNDIVLVAISKSGKTEETLEAFHKTFDILSEKFGEPIKERVLIISTKNSPLWKIAEEKDMEKIEWEGDIGGRFSAFTIAHKSVLAIAGLDAEAFVRANEENQKEDALHLASNIFENYKKEVDILDFFIWASELEDLGKWARQLVAESISLLTPTVSLGPTDLHSMLELYLGGPKNRFTIFIKSKEEIEGSINEEAFENATRAYREAELPFIKYEMPKIDERELGNFMAFMIEMTLELARLLEVNPLDQPAVEKYKSQISNSK